MILYLISTLTKLTNLKMHRTNSKYTMHNNNTILINISTHTYNNLYGYEQDILSMMMMIHTTIKKKKQLHILTQ